MVTCLKLSERVFVDAGVFYAEQRYRRTHTVPVSVELHLHFETTSVGSEEQLSGTCMRVLLRIFTELHLMLNVEY